MVALNAVSRERERRRRKLTPSVTLSLFLVLVAFAVIGRILELHVVVFHMCSDVVFRGAETVSNPFSMVEWMMLIAVLILIMQLLLSVVGLITGGWRKWDAALGTVNVLLATGIFLFWAQLWAWWHPVHPLGQAINQVFWKHPYGYLQIYDFGDYELRGVDDYVGWEDTGETFNNKPVLRHAQTGVTSQHELVYECMPDAIWRANLRALEEAGRLPPFILEENPSDDVYRSIFRDPEGRYMGPSFIDGPEYGTIRMRWDNKAIEYRNALENDPPSISVRELIDIMNDEYFAHEFETRSRESDMSFDEFKQRYLEIVESKPGE